MMPMFSLVSRADSDWRVSMVTMVTDQRNQAAQAVQRAQERVRIAKADLSFAQNAATTALRNNNVEAASIAREAEDVAKDELERSRELLQKATAFLADRERVLLDVRKAVASPESTARGVIVPEKGKMQRFAADGSPITDFSQPIQPGERINIDAGGKGHLFVSRGDAELVLHESTTMKILQDDLNGFTAELGNGLARIRAVVNQWAHKRFEIHTPTAVCAVRGTEFIVRTSDKETIVQVLTGHVVITPKSGQEPLILDPGETAIITPNGFSKTVSSPVDKSGTQKRGSHVPSY
ncbi:MAG: FecR domain-containing protein [Smithella sp.]|jgi:hypothetical protein